MSWWRLPQTVTGPTSARSDLGRPPHRTATRTRTSRTTSGSSRSKATIGASRNASISLPDSRSCATSTCRGSPATAPSTSWATRRGCATTPGSTGLSSSTESTPSRSCSPAASTCLPFMNWAPFIAPDESYLLFSSNRTGQSRRVRRSLHQPPPGGRQLDRTGQPRRTDQHAPAGGVPRTVARREVPVLLPGYAWSH